MKALAQEEKARIRRISRRVSEHEFYKMWRECEFLFMDWEAYGDVKYFRNTKTGEYVETWESIGD